MKRWIAAAAMAAGLLWGQAALAAEQYVAVNDDTLMAAVEIDTVQRQGDIATAWLTFRYVDGSEAWDYLVSQTEFDCRARTQRAVAIQIFDATNARLPFVETLRKDWAPVKESSVAEHTMNAACAPSTMPADARLRISREELIGWHRSGGLKRTS